MTAAMQLLDWRRTDKGAQVGRAKVRLPIGLEISDIGIFRKDGRTWATFPAEPQRDASGQIIKDSNGKPRYRSPLRWSTRDLQDRFSEAIVALIAAEHGL
jgi:hypothetical protein